MDMISALQFDQDQFRELKAHVESRGKVFLSTAFDLPNLRFLADLGLRTSRSPRARSPICRTCGQSRTSPTDVIMSTGMSDLAEVRAGFAAITSAGITPERFTVLQCNTAYPSPASDANLRAMVTMGEDLGVRFGYSDHTEGPLTALAAVAMGATVIEKHFTTDRTLPGPDQAASMEPDDFARLIADIREVERARGSAEKTVTASERENRSIARRGVYAARSLAAGEILGDDDVVCLRPAASMSPMDLDTILGRPLLRPLQRHEPVSPSDVEA